MAIAIEMQENLIDAEREACQRYETEATLLHAVFQKRSSDFQFHPEFQVFQRRCAEDVAAIDSAIRKFQVRSDGSVFSGHGIGIGVVGSLRASAPKFIGLEYCYPGFISTSSEREVAEDFLSKRAQSGTSPVLLEFRLYAGMFALDFGQVTNSVSEFEYLLGREQSFTISHSTHLTLSGVTDQVLHLTLEPATS